MIALASNWNNIVGFTAAVVFVGLGYFWLDKWKRNRQDDDRD